VNGHSHPRWRLAKHAFQTVHSKNETFFMCAMKTFPNTSPKLPVGGTGSSHDQPFQSL
jgi:hypothetical protein